MTEPMLNIEDLHSPTWKKLKVHIESELVGLRVNLEADQTPERTAKLRGQIRSFVTLLALENIPALASEEDDD